jgi:hypothetical protein
MQKPLLSLIFFGTFSVLRKHASVPRNGTSELPRPSRLPVTVPLRARLLPGRRPSGVIAPRRESKCRGRPILRVVPRVAMLFPRSNNWLTARLLSMNALR